MLLDIIESQLAAPPPSCVVGKWIHGLEPEERDGMERLRSVATLNTSDLYRKLNERTELPFKTTSFKAHMRGYCTCPQS